MIFFLVFGLLILYSVHVIICLKHLEREKLTDHSIDLAFAQWT